MTCAGLKKIYIKNEKITPNLLLRIHQGWLVYLKKEEKKYYNYKAISVGFEGRDPEIHSQGVATLQLIDSGGNTEENRRARKSELAVFAVKRKKKKSNKKHVQTQGDQEVCRLRGD